METDFRYGKSSWSEFRDGSRLPPVGLVERVAERYVREPTQRARCLVDGLRLLEAAQEAARALDNERQHELSVRSSAPGRADDPALAAYLRLDDARVQQIEAMERLAASERQRRELEDTVSFLQERCTLLESERDRAREDVHAELQQELQMSLEYKRQADEKLEQARRAEEKAYVLRLAAEKQVTVERVALREISEQDRLQGGAPQDSAGASIIDELKLPPLNQIHAFLEAKQEQLDAQDHDLAHLDERIGRSGGPADPSSPSTRLVRGHVVRDALHEGGFDVQDPEQDITGEPLTSHNADRIAGGVQPDGTRHTPAKRGGEELVPGLEAVRTPAALSTALSQLLQRAGRQSIMNLTKEAFPGSLRDDLLLMTVMRWIDGNVLPDTWPHLESLVRVMGATDREVAAFHQAYTRIVGNFPTSPEASPDLSELPPPTGRLARTIDRLRRMAGRTPD
ncbi:hypothetical protein [Streptomyces sp. NPDC026092]|uniref:hypothetical protein n=1 Tax=Streptomyces sp. NPDC026092 TaxID=3154797 RepID=UPI0033FDDADC